MADNVGITPGTGATAAADDIGGVLYQRVKITTGTDGVADGDVSSANPMPVKIPGVTSDAPLPVRLDQGPEGIISNNGSLQVDATQVNEQSAESLNAPNAILLGDEPVQMVGLHPSYPIPIDTATPMPIAGRDDTGAQRQVSIDSTGALRISDAITYQFETLGSSSPQIPIAGETTGFTTISLTVTQITAGNIGVEQSNDRANWQTVLGLLYNAGGTQSITTDNTAGRILVYPVIGRYWRLNCGAAGRNRGIVVLRAGAYQPAFQAAQSFNLSTIGGAGVGAGSAQLGVNAFGPTAVAAAHGANNPVQMSGSDGTNVRRILTDTSGNTRVVGPLAAGTSLIGATNAAFAPELMGITDLEGKVQRAAGDVRGRLAATLPDATAADDGIIDALNNVVRELKLLNAKITDLPYWLGINSVMPDDGQTFRDDPTLFNQ